MFYSPEQSHKHSQQPIVSRGIQDNSHEQPFYQFQKYPEPPDSQQEQPIEGLLIQTNKTLNQCQLQQQEEENSSPLNLPIIKTAKSHLDIEQKKLPKFSRGTSLFSRKKLEQIVSRNNSTQQRGNNPVSSLRPHKDKQAGYVEEKSFKLRRELQMKQLRQFKKDNNQSHSIKYAIPEKYKNIKPRVMKHTQKIIQGSSSLTDIAIPELESSEVLNDFKIISHVGKGCFSVVSAAVNKKNLHKYAIKTYTKINQLENYRLKNIQSEVRNLFALKHENVIDLKHAVKDGKKIQLIMENGGKQSLSGLLRKVNNFSEDVARCYFRQITEGIAYCHNQNICHRDLKLQNILVDDQGKVKIIDFGFSIKCGQQTRLTSYCGTPPYMSPQIAAKTPYNGLCADIWALGVILYLLLVGKFPFKANNQKQLYRLIQQGKYKVTETISQQAKDLLLGMLRVNQKERSRACDVINSEWLKQTI